jgi:hypothetical protein
MAGLKRIAGCTGIFGAVILGLAVLAAAPQQQAQQPPPPPAAQPPAQPPPSLAAVERASTILAEARKAMGGPALDSIKTLTASGRTRRVRGNNLVPIEFEMGIELPDKYYRKDEFPAEETDPTSQGFNGDGLIQLPLPAAPPPAAAGRPGGPPAPTPAQIEAQRRARVNSIKQDFVRFALGMFAASLDAYPVTFAFAAQAEAPQGKADVLDVRAKAPQAGPNAFALKFFIHSETHLPIMVSWLLPPTNVIVTVPGQPPPATVAPGAVVISVPAPPAAGASQEEKDAYQKTVAGLQAKARQTPVEHRLYFADYRDVNGVKLPFRLRRAIGTDTTEETTFDRYQINGKIDPRRFQIVK